MLVYHYYEHRPQPIYAYQCDNFRWYSHVHAHAEVILVREGQIHITVADKSRMMYPGEMVVVFPNTVHSFDCYDYEGILDIAICAPQLFREYHHTLVHSHPETPFVAERDVHRDIHYAMEALKQESADPDLQACAALISIIFARAIPVLTLQPNGENNPFHVTHKAISYLMQHFHEPMSLDIAAEALQVSKFQLSRIFTNQLNTTFTKYVQQLRIDRAKELLMASDRSVQDICFDCGFDNLRTFDRTFHLHSGKSPRLYRKTATEQREEAVRG